MVEREVVLDEVIVALDGRVVEVFHAATGASQRFHVEHVAVHATPKRGGALAVHVGVDVGGRVVNGIRFAVAADRQAELQDLFELARSRRSARP